MLAIMSTIDPMFLKENTESTALFVFFIALLLQYSLNANVVLISVSKWIPRSDVRSKIGLVLLIISTIIQKIVVFWKILIANNRIKLPIPLSSEVVIVVYIAAFLGFALFSMDAFITRDIDYLQILCFVLYAPAFAYMFSFYQFIFTGVEWIDFFMHLLFDVQFAVYITDIYYIYQREADFQLKWVNDCMRRTNDCAEFMSQFD